MSKSLHHNDLAALDNKNHPESANLHRAYFEEHETV